MLTIFNVQNIITNIKQTDLSPISRSESCSSQDRKKAAVAFALLTYILRGKDIFYVLMKGSHQEVTGLQLLSFDE